MIEEITKRRSIRKYKDTSVPDDLIREIVQAGILAPSSKNRQPWRFVVTSGKSKDEAVAVMRAGLEREEREPLLPDSKQHLRAAKHTAEIMDQAQTVIFVLNTLGKDLSQELTTEERVYEICNAQSIGAAIENMTLSAVHLGLGSLWICDTYFAYWELREWLGGKEELIGALALGYGAEEPSARPRKTMEDVVEWRN